MTTKREKGSSISGWCITGHHDRCDAIYMNLSLAEEYGCTCKHHTTVKVDTKSTKK